MKKTSIPPLLNLSQIPGPRGMQFFEALKLSQRDILGAFQKMHDDYGAIAGFGWPMNSVFIYTPEDIKKVLVDEGRKFVKGDANKELEAVLGKGLATNNDYDSWLRNRTIISKEFGPKAIEGFIQDFEKITEEYLTRLNGTVDICEEMKHLTFVIACRTLLSSEMTEKDAQEVNDAVFFTSKIMYERIFKMFPLPYWLPTPENAEFKRHVGNLDRIVNLLIAAEKKKNNPAPKSILERLVHSGELNDQELRDEVLTFLLAGHETSAHSLTWIMGLLAANPHVQDQILRGENLKEVLLEGMRLYPAFPVIAKKSLEEITLSGYKIPAGTNVVIPLFVVQRDPQFWNQPSAFLPERFKNDMQKNFAYVPFSKGPRKCIGELFAVTEMEIIVRAMVKTFKMETGTLPEPVAFFSLKPKTPLMVKLTRRN